MHRYLIFIILTCVPLILNASFIESTIGAAVVQDATATYFNPAALSVLKKRQVVALGAMGYTHSIFNGQTTQLSTGFTETGPAHIKNNYNLPSIYYGMPLASHWFLGLAVIGNDLAKNIEDFSILRYAQSNNNIGNVDFVSALTYQFKKFFSIGGGLYRSYAHFLLEPTMVFRHESLSDIKSYNQSAGDSWGWDFGLFIRPRKKTIIGLNHRSPMTFNMQGTSQFNSTPPVISTDYHFNYWIPARTALSISNFFNSKFGLIGTVQYIQWDIFQQSSIYNLASQVGILPIVTVPYHYQNGWIFTAGSIHRMTAKWTLRTAGSYLQSPSDGAFQIDNGDTITLGASMAYAIYKHLTIDCSYAHAFIMGQDIHIQNIQNAVNGSNKGDVDAFALKLTINV